MYTAQGFSESLDFGVELFGGSVGGAVVVVVEDFVVVELDGVHDGLEGVDAGEFHVVVPAGEIQSGGVLGGVAVEDLS